MLQKILPAVLSLAFLATLWLPLFKSYSGWPNLSRYEVHEGRRLAKRPVLSKKDFFRYPQKFDDWYQDNFGLRPTLILLNNTLRYEVFNVSTTNRVIQGEDGWFFLEQELESASNKAQRPFTQGQLDDVIELHQLRKKVLEHAGIKYLFLIPPSKITIFSEKWPHSVRHGKGPSRIDQFFDEVAKKGGIDTVDMRPAVFKARKEMPQAIYFSTDSHWNDLGGYVGYSVFLGKLAEMFPDLDLKPVPLSNYNIEVKKTDRGGINRMLGVYYPEYTVDPYLTPKTPDVTFDRAWNTRRPDGITLVKRDDNSPNLLPKVMVYRDSFFTAMTQYFVTHVKQTELYPRRYYSFDLDRVLKNKPTLVIAEIVQRNFGPLGPHEKRELARLRKMAKEEGLVSSRAAPKAS